MDAGVTDTVTLPAPGERGGLDIHDRVVETIVRKAAASETLVQRASGLSRLVNDDFPRASVTVHAGIVEARVTVAAQWPSSAAEVAERTRERVVDHVRDQTGLTVGHVNVTVQYVSSQPDEHEARRVQ